MLDHLCTYVQALPKIFKGDVLLLEEKKIAYNFSRAGALITGVMLISAVAGAVFAAAFGGFIAASFFALILWDLTMIQINISKATKPITANNAFGKIQDTLVAVWKGFDTNLINHTTITNAVFLIYKKVYE